MGSSRRWLAAGALLLLAACSKDKDIDQPAKLTDFSATIRAQRVWTASVADKGAKPLRLGLGLAVEGNRVFAAGHKGEVAAFDLATGRTLWHTKTKLALSGGPGAGVGLVVVGSTFGDLVALNSSDGTIRWKVRLNGEVLSAPAISERLIAIRTVDGKLHGIAPKDGQELWASEQQVPRLSLRGTSTPVMTGDLVLCGFDNGKVAAVNANDGSIQWETTISPAHGKTELERLDDVDASVRVSGSDVYAIGFQGRISMLALDTGQTWWSHDASSFRGLGLDDSSIYISSADGDVVALRRRTGTELWRQKALAHRRLSAAVETDTAIVTGDYQGYVHWLDKATGALAARVRAGTVRISNAPLVVGDMVLVVNDAGHITAFRTSPTGGKRAAKPQGAGATGAAPAVPADAASGSTAPAAPSPGGSTAPVAPPPAGAPAPAAPEPPSGSPQQTPESVPQPQTPESAPQPQAASQAPAPSSAEPQAGPSPGNPAPAPPPLPTPSSSEPPQP